MVKFLRSVSIFKTFDFHQLAYLSKMFKKEKFDPDEIIISEGESGRYLYIIYEGSVSIVKQLMTGDYFELAYLTKGFYFGEFSMLMVNLPRTATVRAVEETTLFTLSLLDYSEFCSKFPGSELTLVRQFLFDTILKLQNTTEAIGPVATVRNKYFGDDGY